MEYTFSSIRAKRVVTAFVGCVQTGQMSEDYAIALIEDTQRYGYLTEGDKNYFYEALEPVEPVEESVEDVVTDEP